MNSFKRLSPAYIGPHLSEELRQRFEAFQPSDWTWNDRSEQLELIVCDLDSETTGYLAIQQLPDARYRINCVLDEKFHADAEVVSSKIFDSPSQAKAFLDSVLAFETPPSRNITVAYWVELDAEIKHINYLDLSYPDPETAMPEKEYDAKLDSIIDAAHRELKIHPDRAQRSQTMFNLVRARITKKMDTEMERDPLFKMACWYNDMKKEMEEWATFRRPKGAYRPNGVLPIAENIYVFMPKATRNDLLSWALCEKDERNLEYIRCTLAEWDQHLEIKTLGELTTR